MIKRVIQFYLLISISMVSGKLVRGEYRVFQYYVKSNHQTNFEKDKAYIVTSSFNPVSYLAYHGGLEAIKIDVLRTWLCPGYTGNKAKYCASPYYTQVTAKEKNEKNEKNEKKQE